VDYCFDIFFFFDIVLRYNFFAVRSAGKMLTDKKKVSSHYRQGRFRSHVISSMPIELIFIPLALSSGRDVPMTMALCRILKLVRVRDTLSLARRFDRATEELFQGFFRANTVKLVKLLVAVLLVSHVAGCMFYGMATFLKPGGYVDCSSKNSSFLLPNAMSPQSFCEWGKTWVGLQITENLLPTDGGDALTHYIRSVNWALPTLVVVVIGDVTPVNNVETLYALVIILVGLVVNAAIIGNIASMVADLDTLQGKFREKTSQIERFMDHRRLPASLRNRTRNYLEYLWQVRQGIDERSLVQQLPTTLRAEILCHEVFDLLKRQRFLDAAPDGIIRLIALELKLNVFSPGDDIVSEGDMAFELFFIQKGAVEVVSSSGQVFARLSAGMAFGEGALLTREPRMASVRALDYCECYAMSKEHFDFLMRDYPDERIRILQTVKEELQLKKKRNTHDGEQQNRRLSGEQLRRMSAAMVFDAGLAASADIKKRSCCSYSQRTAFLGYTKY
jgi:CRP-like cAMP-binding protein